MLSLLYIFYRILFEFLENFRIASINISKFPIKRYSMSSPAFSIQGIVKDKKNEKRSSERYIDISVPRLLLTVEDTQEDGYLRDLL